MEQVALVFLHIVTGFMWAGGAIVVGFWIVPAIQEAGPAGGPVMAGIMKRKWVLFMTVTSWTAILTGLRLYMIRFSTAWLTSAEGIVITLGMLLAIGAAVIGLVSQRPTSVKMAAVAEAVRAKGGPPSPEQAAEMKALGERLARIAKVTAFHLLGALVLMAAHRLAAAFV